MLSIMRDRTVDMFKRLVYMVTSQSALVDCTFRFTAIENTSSLCHAHRHIYECQMTLPASGSYLRHCPTEHC